MGHASVLTTFAQYNGPMAQQGQGIKDRGGDRAEPRTWPSWHAHLVFWSVLAGGLAFDLWTKKAIFERLGANDTIQVIPGFLRLITALNDGAAFSLASGRQPILIGIAGAAFLVILGLFFLGGRKPLLITIVLGLFGSGVLGNLSDRVFNQGLVRDFIDVYIGTHHWPTFNVADSLLCVAVGLLLIAGPLTARPCQTRGQPQR
jgi:signal peptidase II